MPSESHETVRCLGCHAVYELTAESASAAPACPVCGGVDWLAATIPVPQTDTLQAT